MWRLFSKYGARDGMCQVYRAGGLKKKNTFCTAINEWLETLWVIWVNHSHKSRVYPSSSLNTIETTDDYLELHVIVLIQVLDFSNIWSDFDAFNALFYKSSRHLCFRLPYVRLTEEKLPIQVRDINCVCDIR
jgi:hypothetical protein